MNVRQEAPSESTADVHSDGHGSRAATLPRNGTRHGGEGIAGKFREQPVLNTLLVAVCIAAIVLACTTIGPASQSSGQGTRTTTVKRGVVQSTVSGSGNVQSADQLNLGFKTSGTVTHIYVKAGQHVTQGQLLATLDPKSAEVSLEQAKATLQSAEANLAKEEENEGETSSSQVSSGQGSSNAGAASASAASTSSVSHTTFAAVTTPTQTPPQSSTTTTGTGRPTTTTGTSTTPTTTTTTPAARTTPTSPKSSSKSGSSRNSAKATETSSSGQGASGTGSTTKQSAATREANLASAKAAVKSDKLTVQSDEQAVQDTKLYAPEDGSIVSLSGEVGETVSGTGTTRASSSTSSSGSSGSTGGAGGGKSPTGGSTGSGSSSSSSSSSSTSSSSSSFAVLSNLESLQLVVALSESEIGNVHVGQIASVTIEALNGRKVAAHVVSVSQVPTSSSGAVSYDVTFQLDQEAEGLKVGMSATAEVVVKQAEGLNVPTSAIKAGSVTIVRNGKQEARQVTTGLAGDSSTIILSGLRIGEVVALPTSASSGSSPSSGLGSRSSRGGGLGGGLGGGGGFPVGGPPGG